MSEYLGHDGRGHTPAKTVKYRVVQPGSKGGHHNFGLPKQGEEVEVHVQVHEGWAKHGEGVCGVAFHRGWAECQATIHPEEARNTGYTLVELVP